MRGSHLQEDIRQQQQKRRPTTIERHYPYHETRHRGSNAEALKWYLSLNMNFCKSTSPGAKTNPAVRFCSEVLKSIDTHELDYQFHVGYTQIV